MRCQRAHEDSSNQFWRVRITSGDPLEHRHTLGETPCTIPKYEANAAVVADVGVGLLPSFGLLQFRNSYPGGFPPGLLSMTTARAAVANCYCTGEA